MVYWGKIRVDKSKWGHIMTLPNSTFGQLFMWNGANKDEKKIPIG